MVSFAREEHSDLACRKSYPLRLLCACIGSSGSYQDNLSVLLVDSLLNINVPTLRTQIKNNKNHSLDYLSGKPLLSIHFLGFFLLLFFTIKSVLLLKELEEKLSHSKKATNHRFSTLFFQSVLFMSVFVI